MFELTRAKYTDALASAEEMQKALETEMENLGISCEVLSNNWFGQQSENTLGMMRNSLHDGNYRKAYAYTKGVTQIMGEYLPKSRR